MGDSLKIKKHKSSYKERLESVPILDLSKQPAKVIEMIKDRVHKNIEIEENKSSFIQENIPYKDIEKPFISSAQVNWPYSQKVFDSLKGAPQGGVNYFFEKKKYF